MKSNLYKLILLLAIVVFSVVSCGDDTDKNNDNKDQTVSNDDSSEKEDTSKNDDKEQKTDPITVRISAPKIFPALTFARVIENGGFSEDIKVDFKILNKPTEIPPIAKKEDADLLFMPMNLASVLYNNGLNYQAYKVLEMDLLYIVTTNDDINSVKDLNGKDIHVFGRGATPDILLRYTLDTNGIDPDNDTKLVYQEAPQLAQLMIANEIETAVLPEPLATKCTMKNDKVKIITSFGKELGESIGDGFKITQAVLMINKTFAEKHSDTVKQISDLYDKEVEELKNNTYEFSELASKHEIFASPPIINKITPKIGADIRNAMSSKDLINKYLNILFEFNPKTVGGKIPDEGFYYSGK